MKKSDDELCGYHLVWTRDLGQSVSGVAYSWSVGSRILIQGFSRCFLLSCCTGCGRACTDCFNVNSSLNIILTPRLLPLSQAVAFVPAAPGDLDHDLLRKAHRALPD
jgi:hypothetical protein